MSVCVLMYPLMVQHVYADITTRNRRLVFQFRINIYETLMIEIKYINKYYSKHPVVIIYEYELY